MEFLVMALAGTFVGAALGATRNGAPRPLRLGFLALAAVAIVVAVVLLVTRR